MVFFWTGFTLSGNLFFDLLQEEASLDTGGGRVLLPRCNLWSSGHPPALWRWNVPLCAQLVCCCEYMR